MDNFKRCVIVTAGPMGPYDLIKPGLRPDDFFVCADGGTRHAEALGITPNAAVGDFDSFPPPQGEGIDVRRFKKEKDETDTILAVQYGLERGFHDFLILGGLRGRIDHTVANFCALKYLSVRGCSGYIADGDNEVYLLSAASAGTRGVSMTLKRRVGYYVSAFPLGGKASGVTERGLKYSLTDAELDNTFPVGVSNEFRDEAAVVSVREGDLLIILSRA